LYLLTSPICKDAHFLQNNNKNQYTKPFHWVILKKADAVSMVTSAKYDGAFYNTPPPPPSPNNWKYPDIISKTNCI
jgi:hypothetical protein